MAKENKGLEIMNLYRSINGRFRTLKREQFKHLDLTGTQGMMVGMIVHFGPIKMSDLSHRMNLSTSTVSAMVDRLEKTDVLVRTRDENDRRIVRVGLSDRYKKKALEHSDCFEKFATELFSKVSPEEIDTILDGLIILDKLFEMKIENKKGGPSRD